MAIKGFSLLEVMLVVLVMGIVAGLVTMNYSVTSSHRNPDEVLSGLVEWCDLMRQEAVLREQALSVNFNMGKAIFFAYDPDADNWDSIRLPHYFSPDILVQTQSVQVETAHVDDPGPIFLPNGRLSGFVIRVKFSDGLTLGIRGSSEGQCEKI